MSFEFWPKSKANRFVGLPDNFFVQNLEDFELAGKKIREARGQVRRNEGENSETERQLTNLYRNLKGQWFRRKSRICPNCPGGIKNANARQCQMCEQRERSGIVVHTGLAIADRTVAVHAITDDVPIPSPKVQDALAVCLQALKDKAIIGASFLTTVHIGTVRHRAHTLGVKVTSREIKPTHAAELRRVRVWFTDGKTMKEVNAIIEARQNKTTADEAQNLVSLHQPDPATVLPAGSAQA